jgi:uncharacterized membrane protein YhaH (DUF805 family)
VEWYTKVLRQYADFSGRARRKEYWMFYLVDAGVLIGWGLLVLVTGAARPLGADTLATLLTWHWLGGGYLLATLIPRAAVTTRRFHDTDRSGMWVLGLGVLSIIPYRLDSIYRHSRPLCW